MVGMIGETLAADRIAPRDVENLLACVGASDFQLAEAAVAVVARRGLTRGEMLLGLLTPAARTLHERWKQDRESFASVTLATGQLHRLLRSAAMPPPPLPDLAPAGGSVLVSGLCADPRPFEAAIVADFFRSAQWDTECLTPRTEQELALHVGGRAFDLVVLAIGMEADLASGQRLVRRLRQASANRDLLVLVTGPRAGADVSEKMEADGTAKDAAEAIHVARDLVLSRVA